MSLDGERVSSTRIRAALQAGAFDVAARLLGRPYAIGGRVVRGQQLGRTLGYPTANLRFGNKAPALSGIYATRVHGVGAQPWPSVSSFGTRPTVGGIEPLLEAHLFDFDGDLYGRRIDSRVRREAARRGEIPRPADAGRADGPRRRAGARKSCCNHLITASE